MACITIVLVDVIELSLGRLATDNPVMIEALAKGARVPRSASG
jgi:hypothetical protein